MQVLHQEAISIVPRQEDILQHISHSFLFESQVLGSHYRRVDKIKSTKTNHKDIGDCGGTDYVRDSI